MGFLDDHDFHHEPSFMEKYPWATPVIVLAFFFTFVGILYYCMYKNCREYLRPWRQPTVVVIQAPPNGTTNVQYPGYPGNTNFQIVPGNNQGGINMPSAPGAYTGGSNINADPPPYRVVVDGSQNTTWTQK